MTREQFLKKREECLKSEKIYRALCPRCRNPEATCYCNVIVPFSCKLVFAILMHRMETKRKIATGRMAHLCLKNSLILEGVDFTEHEGVNALIADPKNHCVVLSPGPNAVNLTTMTSEQRTRFFPESKRVVVFVIDATWSQAKRMRRLSRNLHSLPMVFFTPQKPSQFLVRKQPAAHCYSTIEAIHEVISLVEGDSNASNLLTVFSYMVKAQLNYIDTLGRAKNFRSTRGKR